RGDSRDEAVHEAERKANAALNVAFSISFVTGPVLAGAVVAGAGAPAALFIDVGTFLICGALLLDLYPHVEDAGGDSVRARLRAGIFALGAAFVGYAAAPSLALGCLAAFVGGAGNGLDWPSLISLVQRLTPKHLHGRMMGATESLGSLTMAVGLPLGGALVALSSPRAAFLILGLATLVIAAVLVRLTAVGLEPAPEEEPDTRPLDAPPF